MLYKGDFDENDMVIVKHDLVGEKKSTVIVIYLDSDYREY